MVGYIKELRIWNKAFKEDYELMGDHFDPKEESVRNLREFAKFAPYHEAQMREMFLAFLGGVV